MGILGIDGRHGTQRLAIEESHLDIFRETTEGQKPTVAGTVKGRIPADVFLYIRNDFVD
jgi:hypothetical protein